MKLFTIKEAWIWAMVSIIVILLAIIGTMMWQRYYDDLSTEPTSDKNELTKENQHQRGFGRWREQMGFTPEQDEQLKELREEFREVSGVFFKNLRANQQQIFGEMEKDTPDKELLNRLAEETGQLHAAMRKATISHMLAIKEITTPEQYKKMAEMMQQWMMPGAAEPRRQRQHRHQQPESKDDCNH
jgi:Spy/CpxP family protein refolding chaperone